jgi:flagellar hook-basal body complex protein FliE
MEVFKSFDLVGDAVSMRATNGKHFGVVNKPVVTDGRNNFIGEFGDILNKQLGQVNGLQLSSEELTQKLAITPDEVNIHEVMIAAEKAQLALNFTKTVRDKLVNAYQTLVNLR